MHGNVISSEYTINEYIHNVPRHELKNTFQEYLPNAPNRIFKSMYHYNKNFMIHYIVHDWLMYSSIV